MSMFSPSFLEKERKKKRKEKKEKKKKKKKKRKKRREREKRVTGSLSRFTSLNTGRSSGFS